MIRRAFLAALLMPAAVAAQSPPPTLPPLPRVPLAPGVTEAGPGTWRVAFSAEGDGLAAPQAAAIGRLGAVLASGTIGRVTLIATASGGDEPSVHRRLTLARALAVKAALVAGGLVETRIDIRPLGRTDAGLDAVDILAPTARRS